jgi:hypothetical protein
MSTAPCGAERRVIVMPVVALQMTRHRSFFRSNFSLTLVVYTSVKVLHESATSIKV